jgi:hypothetical protein
MSYLRFDTASSSFIILKPVAGSHQSQECNMSTGNLEQNKVMGQIENHEEKE